MRINTSGSALIKKVRDPDNLKLRLLWSEHRNPISQIERRGFVVFRVKNHKVTYGNRRKPGVGEVSSCRRHTQNALKFGYGMVRMSNGLGPMKIL